MDLKSEIVEVRTRLTAGGFPNEAAVSQGVLIRLLHALSWPVFDSQVVYPEFSIAGRRVDYALCHPAKKPVVFIEVKKVGAADGAERQLFEYAFHEGVPMVVLTDGQEWHFFLPAGQGAYDERRVYKLDLLARTPEESADLLKRYLLFDEVCSGEAIKNAQDDYQTVRKRREVKSTLSTAWNELICEPDELLVELLCDRVESLCGFSPEIGDAIKFLHDATSVTGTTPQAPKPPAASRAPLSESPRTTPTVKGKPVYELFGESKSARSAMALVIEVFKKLNDRDPKFFEKFGALPKHGRKRRFIAKDKLDLYPDRPDLAHLSEELPGGWWIGTNFANREKRRMLEIACEVSGIEFGRDLKVDF